jgi:nucleotide-binding universal stress UspA family protein
VRTLVGRSGFRSLLIGVDGSPNSRRAVSFVARLVPPSGGRVTVVRVVEPVRPPSMALLPASARAQLGAQAAALHAARLRVARSDVEAAARRLRGSGWRTRGEVRSGVPLSALLEALGPARADLLVLGARGVGGVARFLLGSVADAATKRSPISVLIVK